VYVTESNGGVMAATLARDHAVGTLLSGPVGGVIGTQSLSAVLGEPDLISADVGGTSFDVSLVRDGEPSVQTEFDMQGLPVLAPAVEVHTVGAGGGSIISVDPSGRLRVGPESAGAEPGPACYGRGGGAPTITDAHLLLGRIPAEQRLGGTLALDVAAAAAAMAATARLLGLTPIELAEQAMELINFRMAEAIRELTVERGLDPAGFTLCAFGGAGGLHAADLAEELEIGRIVVPAMPGSFSAWGMLRGGIRHDLVRSFFRSSAEAATELAGEVDALVGRIRAVLGEEGVAAGDVLVAASADLRYAGQEYSLRVPVPDSRSVDELVGTFHRAYRERYGHANPDESVEFVALRVAGSAAFSQRTAPPVPDAPPGPALADTSARFGGRDLPTRVCRRAELTGQPVPGPALVLEETATTVVPPGWQVRPVTGGHLVLDRTAGV
jgi:N-methylhydantoinase A